MLVTELYNGQGLGNQLWCYCVTRSIALRNNYKFGIQSPEKFKGKNLFKNIDLGLKVEGGSGPEGGPPDSLPIGINNYYREKKEINPIYGCDVSRLDKNLLCIPDNTKIDGTMQSEDYILESKKDIIEWLSIKEEYNIKDFCNDDTCVINLRGTPEYILQHQLFLQPTYYYNAIKYIRQSVNKDMKFIVITDDVETSKKFFPDFEIYHKSLEWDYAILNNARYAIISNSSFAWFPIWTSLENKLTIAPKYWARHNISNGFWSNGDSLTRNWLYLGKDGNIYTYRYCLKEKAEFEKNNNHLYV